MLHALFVCSKNRLRSPTAAQVFSGREGVATDSAGLSRDAEVPLVREHVEWADLIFVMEKSHLAKLRAKFGQHLKRQRVICLEIPDLYPFMDPALISLLERKVPRHLDRAV